MMYLFVIIFFFFKQKTAYEMRISDWSSDVCSSDLVARDSHSGEDHDEASSIHERGNHRSRRRCRVELSGSRHLAGTDEMAHANDLAEELPRSGHRREQVGRLHRHSL